MKKRQSSQEPFAFQGQFPDEQVLLVFRRHIIAMRKGFYALAIPFVIGAIPYLLFPDRLDFLWFPVGGLAIGILGFLYHWIGWHFSVFIVTDQRFIQVTQKGLFSRSVVDMGLGQIQMVNYEVAGLQETLLGFGTIMMQTFVGNLVIHEVHHPGKIQKKLLSILREQGIAANPYAPTGDAMSNNEQEA